MADGATNERFDAAVVGGGLVGLAAAWALAAARPAWRLVVLEKESDVALHQSGHNSGVLHSGLYYAPGSLKARLCRSGKAAVERYCDERGIAWERTGKVVVATAADELARLDELERRGHANGIDVARIDAARLRELEPAARGVAALHVPESGIVDYPAVARSLAAELRAAGHAVRCGVRVRRLARERGGLRVEIDGPPLRVDRAVVAGGLFADRLARASGVRPAVRVVPFRGEYHLLRPGRESLCRGLIYPVPDPRFPFLGVHLTRTVHGRVEVGPNAVLAFAREGYRRRDVNLRDLAEALAWPGLLRLLWRHPGTAVGELARSSSRARFALALQRLVPEVRAEDLEPAPAGVRAQALRADGGLVDDFELVADGPALHVLNAPSPAATASLAIGEHVAEAILG